MIDCECLTVMTVLTPPTLVIIPAVLFTGTERRRLSNQ